MKRRTPEQLAEERNLVLDAISEASRIPDGGIQAFRIEEATGLHFRRVDAALQHWRQQGAIVLDPYPLWRLA